MLDLADALKAEPARSAAKGAAAKSIAANKTFTMRKLRRLTAWDASSRVIGCSATSKLQEIHQHLIAPSAAADNLHAHNAQAAGDRQAG